MRWYVLAYLSIRMTGRHELGLCSDRSIANGVDAPGKPFQASPQLRHMGLLGCVGPRKLLKANPEFLHMLIWRLGLLREGA